MERINFQVIEKKWQERFKTAKLYNKEKTSKKDTMREAFIKVKNV